MTTTTETSSAQLDLGRYACPLCPARFDSVGEKKRHIRDRHPKEMKR